MKSKKYNESLQASEAASNAFPEYWSGVFAMSLCIFALVASEFMPVSLLTPIAADLHISEGMVGRGVAVSGAFAVITSLLLAFCIGRADRKKVLLVLTALMGISGAIVALAHNYLLYMAGRALLGVVIGGFWSLSAAMAMRLVPPTQVAKALAVFNGGNALAVVIAAPLGSYLGAIVGWRGAFFALVPVAAVTWIWQYAALPVMRPDKQSSGRFDVLAVLKYKAVSVGMAGCGLFFMGQFALFTYLRPFLETTARIHMPRLSLVLLLIGVAGFLGTLVIGRILKKSLYVPLVAIPAGMALIACLLIFFGSNIPVVVILLGLWGLLATSAPVGWWAWIPENLPDNAEAGGGLMVAVIQLSIAGGSAAGGILYDASGYRGTFLFASFLLAASSCIVFMSAYRRKI